MKLCVVCLLGLLLGRLSYIASAQTSAPNPFLGVWQGKIVLQNNLNITVIFHFEEGTNHVLSAKIDVPAQSVQGMPAKSVTVKERGVEVDFSAFSAQYVGTLSEDRKKIVGTWRQAGIELPLTLEKVENPTNITPNRPQEPKPPFPYTSREVSFPNPKAPGVTLAGTLTLPKGEGPFPAALLIDGSGPNNRDEEVFGHKIFLVLADYLTRHNIAVLRYDKRGIGKSTGDYASATLFDFASDAEAALTLLMHLPEIDPKRVGIIGHSEGGVIGPIVASHHPRLAFLVLLAGTGIRGDKLFLMQTKAILEAQGAPKEVIEKSVTLNTQLYKMALKKEALDKKKEEMLAFLAKEHPEISATQRERAVAELMNPWMLVFLRYDPTKTLQQVHCPVLAVGGGKDVQVPPEANLAQIRKALLTGGNKEATIHVFPNLNHLFQPCKTGSPLEYSLIETTFDPNALDYVTQWILEHLPPTSR